MGIRSSSLRLIHRTADITVSHRSPEIGCLNGIRVHHLRKHNNPARKIPSEVGGVRLCIEQKGRQSEFIHLNPKCRIQRCRWTYLSSMVWWGLETDPQESSTNYRHPSVFRWHFAKAIRIRWRPTVQVRLWWHHVCRCSCCRSYWCWPDFARQWRRSHCRKRRLCR